LATRTFARFGGLGLYTETPLHCGAESGAGYVDLPVQRERHTSYPVVPGSTIKGVLRDELQGALGGKAAVEALFGKEDASSPGQVAFGDGQLVAFPVRSSEAPFHWVTCPFALTRALRAAGRALTVPAPAADTAWAAAMGGEVLLEEIVVRRVAEPTLFAATDSALAFVASLVPTGPSFAYVRELLATRLLVVTDDAFRELVETGTEVVTRIKLNYRGTTTTVPKEESDADGKNDFERQGNLFVEELVPADTLFFAPLRAPGAPPPTFVQGLQKSPLIRLGGDETIGRGLTHATYLPIDSGEEG
jgi:CRISPR-associated protein Cmr4